MPSLIDRTRLDDLGEIRLTIPRDLLDLFDSEPRVVIKWRPDGEYPIDPGMLGKLIEKFKANPELAKNFEVVLMNKAIR